LFITILQLVQGTIKIYINTLSFARIIIATLKICLVDYLWEKKITNTKIDKIKTNYTVQVYQTVPDRLQYISKCHLIASKNYESSKLTHIC